MSYLLKDSDKKNLEKEIYSSTSNLRLCGFPQLLAILDEVRKIEKDGIRME